MSVVAFTSLNFGYISRGLVLLDTIRVHHPDWRVIVLVVERRNAIWEGAERLEAFDQIVFAEDLGIERFDAWMFKHDVVEACTAVKGAMLCRLLDEGADRVVYLDPDIAVLGPLGTTVARLDAAGVVLTPHQTQPNTKLSAIRDNEMTSMQYGIYNLGFLAVRRCESGLAFAHWWRAQLLRECYDEPERGVFTDQKFCDIAPSLFDSVAIERDPGCNVASWNLSQRHLNVEPSGAIAVNGVPLKFYHFTKIFGVGETMTDRYASKNSVVYELRRWYRRQVGFKDAALPDVPPWSYGAFDDGSMVQTEARRTFRRRRDLFDSFDSPFQTGRGSFHTWLAQEMPQLLAGA